MNPLQKTQETYRRIAADYAVTWHKGGTVEDHLQKFAALLPQGATVMDVGCGPGLDSVVLQSHHLNVIGLDYSYEMMRVGRDEHNCRVPLVQADMRCLPVGQPLDGVWASASLLHLQRDDMLPTLQEFWRVLKPNGVLYFSVKQGDGEDWVRTEKYGHDLPRFFTFWQPETLDPLLETAAFQIIDGFEEQGARDRWVVRYARKEEPKP